MRLTMLVVVVLGVASLGARAEGVTDRARLQAAMQQHIERTLVDGAILRLSAKTGKTERFYPTQAHPVILTSGDYFVLCTNLRDKDGNNTTLDLYMAQRGRSFTVFHSEIGNRTPLMKLLKDGIVKPLR